MPEGRLQRTRAAYEEYEEAQRDAEDVGARGAFESLDGWIARRFDEDPKEWAKFLDALDGLIDSRA